MVEPLACCLRGVDAPEIAAGRPRHDRRRRPDRPDALRLRRRRRRHARGRRRPARAPRARAALRRRDGRGRKRGRRDRSGRHRGGVAATRSSWSVRAAPSSIFGGREADARLRVDAYRLHYEELTLRGAFHHAPRHVRAALAFLASGAYPWERLVTHQVGLEGVAGALRRPAARLPEGRRRFPSRRASGRARARRAAPRGRPRRSGSRATRRA